MTTLLAGDIGGTKTLLALYERNGGQLIQLQAERYPSADWPQFPDLINHFLAHCRAGSPALEAPRAGCLAVAGPVLDGRVKVTNLPWELRQTDLAQQCGLDQLELVNDFAVLIYGLPHLSNHQQALLREGHAVEGAPVAILGAGTGLGVAIGAHDGKGLIAMASEAGHGEFAARTEAEWRLKQWLQTDLGAERLSIERIVSGTGLGHVFRWLVAERRVQGVHPLAPENSSDGPADLPAAVAAAAEAGDVLAMEALDLWLGAYGSVAGDLALQCLCRGGLWLGGGTAGKLLGALRSPRFFSAFQHKGRLAPQLETIPVRALIDPEAGLFSAACRARMLLA
ncbi:MAG: glucokinase [Synechococcaceae cyanobacterium ELA445]